MNFTNNAKFGALVVGIVTGVIIMTILLRIATSAHQPGPRAVVYARTDNAQVQSSDGVDSGVFIQLHDNSPKDKPYTSWSLWLYKYDGAEYLCIVNSVNSQVELIKHK